MLTLARTNNRSLPCIIRVKPKIFSKPHAPSCHFRGARKSVRRRDERPVCVDVSNRRSDEPSLQTIIYLLPTPAQPSQWRQGRTLGTPPYRQRSGKPNLGVLSAEEDGPASYRSLPQGHEHHPPLRCRRSYSRHGQTQCGMANFSNGLPQAGQRSICWCRGGRFGPFLKL